MRVRLEACKCTAMESQPQIGSLRSRGSLSLHRCFACIWVNSAHQQLMVPLLLLPHHLPLLSPYHSFAASAAVRAQVLASSAADVACASNYKQQRTSLRIFLFKDSRIV